MTRVIVSSKAPLGDWHTSAAPLEYWMSSFRDISNEMVLVSGQSQKTMKRHMSSLEHLDKQIATIVLEQYLKLPRSSNPRQKEVDFTLLDPSIPPFGAGAVPELRAFEGYQVCRDQRNRGPQQTESTLESFDRTLGPLLSITESLTIIDAYAISEFSKPKTNRGGDVNAAQEILESRFSLIEIPVTIHAVRPSDLSESNQSPLGAKLPTRANLRIVSHKKTTTERRGGKFARFPHVRLWKFDLSRGSVVVQLDQGFDTFHPRVPGVITDITGLGEWEDNYDCVLVTIDNEGPFPFQLGEENS
jgi:hypothetical protein